jgi:hypothetical protein
MFRDAALCATSNGLQPAKTFFDALPLLLTDGIALTQRRAIINGATSARKSLATSAFSKRSRFLVNTVASHTASSKFSPTNQRNKMF